MSTHNTACRSTIIVALVATFCARDVPPGKDTSAGGRLTSRMVTLHTKIAALDSKSRVRAVQRAREMAQAVNPDKEPRKFVIQFDAALRQMIEEQTGEKIPPLPVDWSDEATPMYVNAAKTIQRRDDLFTYTGSKELAEPRVEAVSLVPPDGEPCTAVVIARNAIATAAHCSDRLPTTFTIGATAGSGVVVAIDPHRFQIAKTVDGTPLDLAILVSDRRFAGIADENLPIFASPEMIAKASELQIVGFGGARADSSAAGDKRLGVVSMSSPDCADAAVAAQYKCKPGFEIVAAARPLVDRTACPSLSHPGQEQGACRGDSGGPVYVEVGNKLYLAAVMRAFLEGGCGCAAATNLYVRLDRHVDFLRSLPNIDFAPGAFAAIDGS